MGNTSGPGAACPGIALHLVLAAVFSVPALANIPDRAIAPSMAAALGGKDVPGPYSVGDFTDVVATTVSPDGIPATIHHELRHVLLEDFGRVKPFGAHGTGKVDQETKEAEKEAVKNSKVK